MWAQKAKKLGKDWSKPEAHGGGPDGNGPTKWYRPTISIPNPAIRIQLIVEQRGDGDTITRSGEVVSTFNCDSCIVVVLVAGGVRWGGIWGLRLSLPDWLPLLAFSNRFCSGLYIFLIYRVGIRRKSNRNQESNSLPLSGWRHIGEDWEPQGLQRLKMMKLIHLHRRSLLRPLELPPPIGTPPSPLLTASLLPPPLLHPPRFFPLSYLNFVVSLLDAKSILLCGCLLIEFVDS